MKMTLRQKLRAFLTAKIFVIYMFLSSIYERKVHNILKNEKIRIKHVLAKDQKLYMYRVCS